VIGDLVVVVVIVVVGGAGSVVLGMLLAPRIGRLMERVEDVAPEEPTDQREP
jgi:hypothetical protein